MQPDLTKAPEFRACKQADCNKPAHARGLCPMHYRRLRTTGDPTKTKFPPLRQRFFAQVKRTDGECMVWGGAKNERGYGVMHAPRGFPRLAHRMSFELTHGAGSARGLMVCHRCDNPPCVNPDHLFLGTNLDNARDMQRKDRVSRVTRVAGANHPKAKLTERDVLAIRDQHANGISIKELAASHFMARNSISRIIARRLWRHI